MVAGEKLSGRIPFRWLLFGIIVLIILAVTGMVLHINYSSARNQFESEVLTLQENTEFSLLQSMQLIDQGYLLFDHSLDFKLKEPMDLFLAAYHDTGGDPGAVDLEELKRLFGEGYELYIIDEHGVIIHTTYPPDYLMDFSAYPWFFSRLTGIRLGGEYVSDRITYDLSTGTNRKFVYHPTPDYRYILEISYTDAEIEEIRSTLHYTEAAANIIQINPYLTSIRIFNKVGDEVGNSSIPPDEQRTRIIADVLDTGVPVQINSPETSSYTRYIYADFSEHDSPEMMNLVAALTYTTAPIERELETLFQKHLLVAGIALLLGGILAFGATGRINRPIKHLVHDTETIASGELDHTIGVSSLPELRSLSLSIQQMVDRLKDMMGRLQASEEELRVQNEELEERVLERTAKLSEALSEQQKTADALKHSNKKLQLLTSITRHDIQNKILALSGYIELAGMTDHNPKTLSYLKEAGAALSAIEEQIAFTGEYEKLGVHEPQWLSLRELIGRIQDGSLPVRCDCPGYFIYADPMVEKVFSNLMDNTLRHADGATEVRISCSETDNGLLILYEDDGPGVLDENKELIFERGFGTNTGYGLFLVREILAITGITIRETGVYGEGARFEILVPEGCYRMDVNA
ncbi:HAMP domain-containing sensor histidine kinase [Methanocalculus sp. MC3]